MENLELVGQAVVASLELIEQAAVATLELIDLLLLARQVWMAVVESANSAQTRVVAELAEARGFRLARVVFRQVVLRPEVVLPLRIGLVQAAVVFPGPIGSEGEMVALLARVALMPTGLARAAAAVGRQDQRYRHYKG